MSIKIMSYVFDAPKESDNPKGLTPTETLVALSLADHASDDGRNVYPGQTLTSRKTKYDVSTVSRTINGLIQKGWLGVERKATPIKPAKLYFRLDFILGLLGSCAEGGPRTEQDGGVPAEAQLPPRTEQNKPSITIIETSGSNSQSDRPRGTGADMPADLKAMRDKFRIR